MMRAIVVKEESGSTRLGFTDVEAPHELPGMAIIDVRATSLNVGDVRAAYSSPAGYRPGWDFAGVISQVDPASGLAVNDRVFGLFNGTWAERIAVPLPFLARMPAGLDFEAAAALPVAGLTAAMCLAKREIETGTRLLVTAATGGVGVLAVQLGAAMGAHVTALVRDPAAAGFLAELGASEIIDVDEAERLTPFDLILDGVGGALLGRVLLRLAPRGVCVNFGDAAGDELTSFDARRFRLGDGGLFGGTSLYGFFLLEELTRPRPAFDPAALLADLGGRAAAGDFDPVIRRQASWADADEVARDLLARRFPGKAVLRVD